MGRKGGQVGCVMEDLLEFRGGTEEDRRKESNVVRRKRETTLGNGWRGGVTSYVVLTGCVVD